MRSVETIFCLEMNGMAFCLTTMLLVIISTVGNGVIRLQKSQAANKRCNIFIKLPADIDEKALDTVISLAYKYSIEGFIATGPTRDRSGLHQAETKQLEKIGNGGVSGRGIGKKSQEVVRYLSEHTDRHFLIIGAGGIMTAEDAAGMISQGADMIQIYSAFIYSGPSIVHKLGNKLKNELK